MERRGKFQGSLWLGLKGLRWALEELGKLKELPSSQAGYFQFLRDGYRTLELSCLSNRGGRFVELVEYHGGSQRGHLRIPEGCRGVGWVKFESELRCYFLTKIDSPSPPSAGDAQVGMVRRSAQGTHNRNKRNGRNSNSQSSLEVRDSRGGGTGAYLAPGFQLRESRHFKEIKVNLQVTLSQVEPRSTRKFDFNWDSGQTSLRITKVDNGPREVVWVRPKNKSNGSKTQTIDPMSLEPQQTGPLAGELKGNEVFPQNTIEASGVADREVSSSEQSVGPSEVGPVAVVMVEEELGSVDSDVEVSEEETRSVDFDDEVSCDPPSVMAAPVLSDSSALALVRVDLADTSQQNAHAGVLALGFTHEQEVPTEIVGLELVLELSMYDAEP